MEGYDVEGGVIHRPTITGVSLGRGNIKASSINILLKINYSGHRVREEECDTGHRDRGV